jgi:two-component system, OmpR family, sensor histidine kinase MprB
VSLRLKLVLALALLAAVASAAIGWFSYQATADRLQVEIDRSLDDTTNDVVNTLLAQRGPQRNRDRDLQLIVYQVIDGKGAAVVGTQAVDVPVDPRDIAVASAVRSGVVERRDVTIGGTRSRLSTTSLGDGVGAVQVARSLEENTRLLDSLRNRIAVAVGIVVIAAALLGWLVARQVTRRLVKLTRTAEEVATTGRLDVSVPVHGGDEAGRLGVAFNEMLGALARSKDDQRRLVQDAGHELRTPLTSLRTNIQVLRRHDKLPPETMGKVLDDLDGEARELTDLTNELVELATDRRADEPEQAVELDAVAERVAMRTRRRYQRDVRVDAEAVVVTGRPQMLERAISNLVDNAAKFDDGGTGVIEVVVRHDRVEVLDRGPGLDPADVPHLFDRFYRALGARSRPGSGLGLAIVKDVAEAHGGTVFARSRPGGGSVIGFTLPATPPTPNSNPPLTWGGASSSALPAV